MVSLGRVLLPWLPASARAPFPGIAFGSPLADAVAFSGWGRPRPARNGVHEGLDFHAAIGTPVGAVADGVVARTGTEDHAGSFLVIHHAGGWTSRYMHLSQFRARRGARVRRGDVIALSGATGVQQSAAHLHFDLLLVPQRLGEYVATFGMPATGFGTVRTDGVGVPAEPLIPAVFDAIVVRDAAANGIPIHTGAPAIAFGALAAFQELLR